MDAAEGNELLELICGPVPLDAPVLVDGDVAGLAPLEGGVEEHELLDLMVVASAPVKRRYEQRSWELVNHANDAKRLKQSEAKAAAAEQKEKRKQTDLAILAFKAGKACSAFDVASALFFR